MDPTSALIAVGLSLVLSLLIYAFRLLTVSGCVASFLIGSVIGVFGSLSWLVLLIVFAILGFAATKSGFTKKKEMGVQEGTHGERNYKNILGVAIPPFIIALLNFIFPGNESMMALGYIATIAVAAADTSASELGVKDPKVWLITNFKRVAPGTDGGVSVSGTVISLVVSLAVSIVGYLVIFQSLNVSLLVPTVCGFIGCVADSVLGATVESKGLISKYTNNAITGIIGGLLTILILSVV